MRKKKQSPRKCQTTTNADPKSLCLHQPNSYVFLGCSRARDATVLAKAFEVEAGNSLGRGQGGLLTPSSPFITSPWAKAGVDGKFENIEELSIGPSAVGMAVAGRRESLGLEQTIYDVGAPLSPFHYQLRKVCLLLIRVPLWLLWSGSVAFGPDMKPSRRLIDQWKDQS